MSGGADGPWDGCRAEKFRTAVQSAGNGSSQSHLSHQNRQPATMQIPNPIAHAISFSESAYLIAREWIRPRARAMK